MSLETGHEHLDTHKDEYGYKTVVTEPLASSTDCIETIEIIEILHTLDTIKIHDKYTCDSFKDQLANLFVNKTQK